MIQTDKMQTDITQTTQTNMESNVSDYSVDAQSIDGVQGKTTWNYGEKFSDWLGYYKSIPEVRQPINNYATWVVGKGIVTDTRTEVILDNITGWGEDNFLSIMWNMIVMKKVNGDSFAHIIKNDTGTLINIKPLDPASMKVTIGGDGIIDFYEQISKIKGKKPMTFKTNEILHLCNDRIADEIHGTSVIEAAEWIILARNQAMADIKRQTHRSMIRVLYVDEDDKARIANLKTDYAEAIDKGELLIIPTLEKDAKFQQLEVPAISAYLEYIRYLENAFYKAIGFPKSLTGDAEGIPESGGKMAYFNHMPVYNREVTDLQNDLWNQLAIKVEFKEQASLTDSMNDTENKNKAQTGFQPSDTQV